MEENKETEEEEEEYVILVEESEDDDFGSSQQETEAVEMQEETYLDLIYHGCVFNKYVYIDLSTLKLPEE
ncbi:hypothetical protein AVEN_198978-1 [Araneus ventricosus]|uniref:Uncharacterized protein n=1 Tax=Araneus ventricosus TaxID=182803 RepID=A0A4Y2CQB2_ARAVE